MAIKELLILQGVEEVQKQLNLAQKAGEDFLKNVRDSAKISEDDLKNFSKGLDDAGRSSQGASEATGRFRDSLHLLHPILRTAGVDVGEFSGFSRAAGTGVLGLSAAIVGTGIVALFRFSQSIAEVKQRLNDVFQSNAAGKKAFDDLSSSAVRFGTTVQSLAPGFEGFLRAFETFQQRNASFKFVALDPKDLPQLKSVQNAYDSLFAALRAGGASEEDAKKAIAEFNAEMKNTGQVTGAALDKLLAVAPGALTQLETALGKAKTTQAAFIQEMDKAPATFGKFVDGLARIKPATEQAFDERPIRSFTENITASFAVIQKAIQDFEEQATQAGKVAPTEIAPVFSELAADATGFIEQIRALFSQNPFDFSGWTSSFDNFFAQMLSSAQTAWNSLQSIFSNPINITAPTFTAPGGAPFASGGLVRGPGTTTSDSIWARLSDKEFVLNARATQFYGADLLYALNALKVPRNFPGFSMGGLVNAMASAMPKFANGGMATAGTPVTFVIDNQRFNMTAPADTVKALSRFAVNRQLSSTGRKPSWVK